jgi:DNA-binding beta-propeller fold protein YncE
MRRLVLTLALTAVVPCAAAAEAGRCLYTAHPNLDAVSVIDVASGRVLGLLPQASVHRAVARPQSADVYVTTVVPDPLQHGRLIEGLQRFDAHTATAGGTIPLAAGEPFDIEFAADGTVATLAFASGPTRLSQFFPANDRVDDVLATPPGVGGALDVAVSADGATGYVTVPYDNQVLVVDIATGTVRQRITFPDDFVARRIALSPDGATAYVTAAPAADGVPHAITSGPGRLAIIDTATSSITALVPLPYAPENIVLTSDGGNAWVNYFNTFTGHDFVGVIDLAGQTADAVEVVGTPVDLAMAPDGQRLYVATSTLTADTISVISSSTKQLVTTIPVPSQAGGLALVDLDGPCGVPPTACPGDCDGNGDVDVSEILSGVATSFDRYRLRFCTAADPNFDGQVDITDLMRSVDSLLAGCR